MVFHKIINRRRARKIKSKNLKFLGKESNKLTKRIPRKKLKKPFEKFKSKKHKKLIKDIYKDLEYLKSNKNKTYIKKVLVSIKKEVKRNFGIDLSKTQGKKLHFFLPMTGMSSLGYFYKGFLEQILPKARVSFLVTPSSSNYPRIGPFSNKTVKNSREYVKPNLKSPIVRNFVDNIKKHLKKCLNKHDRYFVIIDKHFFGRTFGLINQGLKEIYNVEPPLLLINSGEHRKGNFNFWTKDINGKYVMPKYADQKKFNKKAYKENNELHKVARYTFYYLGFKFGKNKIKSK